MRLAVAFLLGLLCFHPPGEAQEVFFATETDAVIRVPACEGAEVRLPVNVTFGGIFEEGSLLSPVQKYWHLPNEGESQRYLFIARRGQYAVIYYTAGEPFKIMRVVVEGTPVPAPPPQPDPNQPDPPAPAQFKPHAEDRWGIGVRVYGWARLVPEPARSKVANKYGKAMGNAGRRVLQELQTKYDPILQEMYIARDTAIIGYEKEWLNFRESLTKAYTADGIAGTTVRVDFGNYLLAVEAGLSQAITTVHPDDTDDTDDTKVTRVTYVYEKDDTAPPLEVLDQLNKLNELGTPAASIDDDVVTGLGEMPAQYRVAITEARKAGLPALVVERGSRFSVVRNPQTSLDVTNATK